MKPFAVRSLSVATTFLALSGGALVLAQSPATQLMSGYAELGKTLDTKSATSGEMIEARLAGSIQTTDGMKFPGGTELIGHVDQVQASHNGSEAKITITFDKAKLKDGKIIDIKATLIEVNSPDLGGEVPTKVASDDKFDQQLTASGETLHSDVQATTSGTLMRTDKNISLASGTRLLLAVAPAAVVPGTASGS